MRLAAHAAVLVVDERHVDSRAPDFGILRIEVGSREGVALGIVMCARLIEQEGVDMVAVPVFGVVVRSNAVAIFVSARGRWASLIGQQERSYLSDSGMFVSSLSMSKLYMNANLRHRSQCSV